VVANASLLIAVLVYMGWAYDDALYGYFHVRPLDLDVSVVEYMLRSLSLFSPTIIIATVVLIAVTTVRAWHLSHTRFALRVLGRLRVHISAVPAFRRWVYADAAEKRQAGQVLLIGAGAAITAGALVLSWLASRIQVNTYLLLCLLAGGPLLLTWPSRTERHGRFPYAMAIVVTAVCALWAASLYAHHLGIQTAEKVVRDLPKRTAVAVYSIQPLALSGPGVTVQRLPSTFHYHYRYQGLRLLIARSGTYYLLPVRWNPPLNQTYVFNESDQIRIELLGVQSAG
jgi:hypothetical protein